MINVGTFASSGGVVSYDSDAQAFFTASGITDLTQKNAVNQLVLDLKSNSLWTKIKALYPIVGGNANTKFETEFLEFFSAESEFIQSELHEWNDDEERGQNEISFTTEDLDLGFLSDQKSHLLSQVNGLSTLNLWHTSLKEFINKVLSVF